MLCRMCPCESSHADAGNVHSALQRSELFPCTGRLKKTPRRARPDTKSLTTHPPRCRKFAHACAEALLLCRKLVQYNVGRHLQKGRADLCATCDKFRLSLLLSSDGVRMATGVLMDLLKRHTPSGRLPVSLSDDLLHGCPMFFPYHQQQYLTAFQQLEGVNKPGISACASPVLLTVSRS